jgi:hypothetical protein
MKKVEQTVSIEQLRELMATTANQIPDDTLKVIFEGIDFEEVWYVK